MHIRFQYPWHNPLRLWWCGGIQVAVAANFSEFQWTNNDPFRYLVAIDMQIVNPINDSVTFYRTQTPITPNLSFTPTPIVTGQEVCAVTGIGGVTTTAPVSPDWEMGTSGKMGSSWNHEWPFTVLRPGWSLLAICSTIDVNILIFMQFAMLRPEELQELDMMVPDPSYAGAFPVPPHTYPRS